MIPRRLSTNRFALRSRLTAGLVGVVRNRVGATGQIPLHFVAAFLKQQRVLSVGLDSFRENRRVQAPSETDDRTHDRPGVVVVFQVPNKGSVDLDLVAGERLQK